MTEADNMFFPHPINILAERRMPRMRGKRMLITWIHAVVSVMYSPLLYRTARGSGFHTTVVRCEGVLVSEMMGFICREPYDTFIFGDRCKNKHGALYHQRIVVIPCSRNVKGFSSCLFFQSPWIKALISVVWKGAWGLLSGRYLIKMCCVKSFDNGGVSIG